MDMFSADTGRGQNAIPQRVMTIRGVIFRIKERAISTILASPATDFFKKISDFFRPRPNGSTKAPRFANLSQLEAGKAAPRAPRQTEPFADAFLRQAADGRRRLAYCPRDGADYWSLGSRKSPPGARRSISERTAPKIDSRIRPPSQATVWSAHAETNRPHQMDD